MKKFIDWVRKFFVKKKVMNSLEYDENYKRYMKNFMFYYIGLQYNKNNHKTKFYRESMLYWANKIEQYKKNIKKPL